MKFHWLKKDDFLSDRINFWTKLITPKGSEQKEMEITVDVNLVKNNERELKEEQCVTFFEDTCSKINEQYEFVLN